MNIFLLSMTDNLDEQLRMKLREEIVKRGNRVAYISSEPQEGDRPYYQSTIRDYAQISDGITVDYFDLSENFSDESLKNLLNYGTLYLSGGNTYVFMDSARKRGLASVLEKHLENGGLLVGASAGSIMMTPSIELAGFEDENFPNLTDMTGFNFVNFDFCPHFKEADMGRLSQYMKGKSKDLYICKDGDGIYYNNGEVELFGASRKLL